MFSKTTAWITLGLLASSASAVKLSGHPKVMFDKSMTFLDQLYDDSVGSLYWVYYPLAAGQHETHSTIWYESPSCLVHETTFEIALTLFLQS